MRTDKYENKYRVPSARAVWHDYNGGDYFITICTSGRLHYFGEINNGEMVLNVLGQKLDELIREIKIHNSYAEIPLYQIMPNHVHLIVCINNPCRDVACRVSTGDTGINANGRDVACRVSTGDAGTNANCRDVACRVSTGDSGTNANCRDVACRVSTGANDKMNKIADKCGLLSTAIGGLKSALKKYANLNKIEFGWQTRFHDHIIRSQDEMNLISNYIENNASTWESDKFYTK